VSSSAPVLRGHNVRSLEDRIKVLRNLVWLPQGGLRDPLMRDLGLKVTQHCKARDADCELRAVFDFVYKNVRYTGDIATKDTFQSALRTLQMGGGDCDDMAVLCSVLAMENGYNTRWRITSNTGASWDHIYCMAATPKHRPTSWIALDTTMGKGRFGGEPPRAKFRDFVVAKDEG
jgi:hypothetical protein